MNNDTNHNEIQKKPLRWKYKLAAGIALLCVVAGYIYLTITWKSESQKDSEAIIRQAVAEQFNKDTDELTNEDFINIIKFKLSVIPIQQPPEDVNTWFSSLTVIKLSDIKLLEKFNNLQELTLDVHYPETAIPKWRKILAKVGIFDIEKRNLIDLRPLKKLTNLRMLDLSNSGFPVKHNIGGMSTIGFVVSRSDSPFQDITPLSGLINLKELNLRFSRVSDLEPLRKLYSLEKLDISYTDISNLNPVKEFKNLKYLYIQDCENITDEQVEDLQKALPNLKIERQEWMKY